MQKFTYLLTENGHKVEAPVLCDTVFCRPLVASVAQTITVPAGAKLMICACTGVFFIKKGVSVSIPGGSTDSAPEVNPVMRECAAGEQYSVIAPSDCSLYISFYGM